MPVASVVLAAVVASACGGAGDRSAVVVAAAPGTAAAVAPPAPTAEATPASTSVATPTTSAAPLHGCVIGPPPADLGLPAFYEQWCSVRGLPIVASAQVQPEALEAAWVIIEAMLERRPDVVPAMLEDRIRFGIIGETELTLDMPEYADLQQVFPDVDWNTRARGLGATWERPLVSSAEENLLCLPSDRYAGESITVHEFAHTFLDHGIAKLDPTFLDRVQAAYADAMATGRWVMTYAAENAAEYWAEGVQSWFGTNLHSSPADGVHGEVGTRAALVDHDPGLAALIAEVLPDTEFTPACPDGTVIGAGHG